MTAHHGSPSPSWADGFAVGVTEDRITVAFVAAQLQLLDAEGADTVPTVCASVTMSHATAKSLFETLRDALAKAASDSEGAE